ncbi:MAG TPA: hypothetical protein VKA74_00810, partial [Myxococcota bacterium]|nr:hypothetical protein [Myxococcota bacterium]
MVPQIRSLAAPLALALTMGACADPGLRGATTASPSAQAQPAPEAQPPSPASVASEQVGAEKTVAEQAIAEKALAWHELTELARDHERQGELVEAQERLAQAAAQVASRPPHHATRRAVFGMQ